MRRHEISENQWNRTKSFSLKKKTLRRTINKKLSRNDKHNLILVKHIDILA